jgi:two-component system sensor histidine kinase KdpD
MKGALTLQSQKSFRARYFPFSIRDTITTVLIFASAVICCLLLQNVSSTSDAYASPIFVLAVLLISRFTTGYLFGIVASVLGVICVNFIFIYPYWTVNFTLAGYPLTTLVYLVTSIMTCALTTQARQSERLRAENEKEKMRANLLRSVSHDIRTPLTSIVGSTSVMLEDATLSTPERRDLLLDIRNEAQWLIRIVENLLSITRMGDTEANIQKESEAAEEVLGEASRKFRKRFPGTSLSVSVPDELLMVPMDAVLIEQVLSNLLENAVAHGKTTTHIRLSVHHEGAFARFVVQDNGCGFSEKELPVLFDGSLKHSETTRGDGKRNMGLGLSVCLAIVRAHNGTMDAKNLPNGAEISFRLPLSP